MKISIIIPVFNVIDYIEECFISLHNQTYSNVEFLVVDDGSTDGSGRVCDKYAEIDRRFKVFHTQNHGVSHARNVGLNHIARENEHFCMFVDPDDYFVNEHAISDVADELSRAHCDILFYNYQINNTQSLDYKIINRGGV